MLGKLNVINLLSEILELIDNEKIRDISVDEISFSVEGNPIESKFFRLIRWMTLNGHLLPRFLFKKGFVRARVNGEVLYLEDEIELDKNKK